MRDITVRWSAVALLVVAAGVLALMAVGTSADTDASPATTAGGAEGVFVVAGQLTGDTYGLYMVDTKNQTICMYEWVASKRVLRLMAARTYVYDRQLDEYNTEISPREVRDMVARQKRLGDVPAN